MLKASDRVLNDVMHAFDGCLDYDASEKNVSKQVLNLKKWYDFDRRRELRCFVLNGKLAGEFVVAAPRALSPRARGLTLELFVFPPLSFQV